MAQPTFELKLEGNQILLEQLGRLPEVIRKKVVRPVFRDSLKRVKNEILLNLSGRVVQEQTGRYVNAMERQNPRIAVTRDGAVLGGMQMPKRGELGIEPDAKGYYPAAVEYGVKKGPRPFEAKAPIRKAVNDMQEAEMRRIGDEIGAGILKVAAKK